MTGPRPTQSTSNSNLDRLKSDRGVLPLHTAAEKGGQRGCYPCACTRPDGPVDPSKYAAVFTDECSRKTTAPRFMADSSGETAIPERGSAHCAGGDFTKWSFVATDLYRLSIGGHVTVHPYLRGPPLIRKNLSFAVCVSSLVSLLRS